MKEGYQTLNSLHGGGLRDKREHERASALVCTLINGSFQLVDVMNKLEMNLQERRQGMQIQTATELFNTQNNRRSRKTQEAVN